MNLPNDFITKYEEILQEEAPAFFASFDEPAQKGFRLNPLKADYQNIAYDLSEPVAYVADGYYGEVSGRSLEHQTGYVYSQDLSAMYVAEVADVQPGDKVLDLCAAPGGKSTQLAGKLLNQGLLVSNEIMLKRAKVLAENLERIGAKNTMILNESPERLESTFPEFFDKIVVDAPCSGEGMFRKDPAAMEYWHADYPHECSMLQRTILTSAMTMLKPGGTLVYSTCTYAPEEDEQIVAWLLENYPTLEIAEIKHFPGMMPGMPEVADHNSDLTKTVRLMPHKFKGEGHFIAKLVDTRTATATAPVKKGKKRKGKKQGPSTKISKEQMTLFNEFCQTTLQNINYSANDLKVLGHHLYYVPQIWPDISALKFLRPGLWLGEFKKNRFEPSYALALALNPQTECQKVIEITTDQWADYVFGNTIQVDASYANGWYLLVCKGKAISFSKVVNGTAKNFFPKGLRFKAN